MNRRSFLKFLGKGIVAVSTIGVVGLPEVIEQENEVIPHADTGAIQAIWTKIERDQISRDLIEAESIWHGTIKSLSLSITDGKTTIPLTDSKIYYTSQSGTNWTGK